MPIFSKILVSLLLVTGVIFAAFWFGIVPQTFSPLSPLSLDKRDQWFVDLKLVVLRRDHKLCQSILKQERVVVNGKVEGPIQGGEVVLKSQAHVVGDIHHQSLTIEKGALMVARTSAWSKRAPTPESYQKDPSRGPQRRCCG